MQLSVLCRTCRVSLELLGKYWHLISEYTRLKFEFCDVQTQGFFQQMMGELC